MAQWLEHPTRSRRVVDFSESMFLLEFSLYHVVIVSLIVNNLTITQRNLKSWCSKMGFDRPLFVQ